ncbi:MAG: ATP-dependent DNA helicase RecG [Actinomycetia bacterium]|nr:ATP-dependent DNA helicase RecG [Actinomycetes bacterium]
MSLAELDSIPVDRLRGVGSKTKAGLAVLEVKTVADLLTYYPRRYVDRTNQTSLADLMVGEEALVLGTVERVESRRMRNRRTLVSLRVSDGTGSMNVTFFNQPWRAKQLCEGTTAAFFGKVDLYRNRRQMTSPVVDLVGNQTGRIVPIYPQSEKAGLMTWEIAGLVEEALRRCEQRGIEDPIPTGARRQYGLIDRHVAFGSIHVPETMPDVYRARTRLVFDELFRVQLTLLERKRELELHTRGIEHVVDGQLVELFEQSIPFDLTGAQRRTISEISADLSQSAPMHRLLQGDVGAGKTLVAVHALLVAVQGGHQGALMAPTEVLAEQHAAGVSALVGGMSIADSATLMGERPVRVELLTNKVKVAERRRIDTQLASGEVDVVIGTHALIQDGVEFDSLGMVVVDEQHRFGVEQRSKLRDSGRRDALTPDVLVMTATPIPRTAAMTVYGDLDVSILDELPPGRTPIETELVAGEDPVAAMWQRVLDEVEDGRQAYVVCPLIEESEKLDAASAEQTFEHLTSGVLSGVNVGLLHGRMSSVDKEGVMAEFRSGVLDVLVATTVIEVGVDVANATIMVIESADRFGIAQLHQLRGRVGRGSHASTCFLVVDDEETADSNARLEALVRTTDGFELAEVDLELRGEGTIFNDRQSGRNDLKLASLRRDRDWVARAREVAAQVVDERQIDKSESLRRELEWFATGRDDDFILKS